MVSHGCTYSYYFVKNEGKTKFMVSTVAFSMISMIEGLAAIWITHKLNEREFFFLFIESSEA